MRLSWPKWLGKPAALAVASALLVALVGVGIVLLVVGGLLTGPPSVKEVVITFGSGLVTAGTVGILVEVWIHTHALRQILGEFAKNTDSIVNQFVVIGLEVFFRKENLDSVSSTPAQLAKLYGDTIMKEFREPVVSDFVLTLDYVGDSKTVPSTGRKLIDIKEHVEFVATNTCKLEYGLIRHIYWNGVIFNFSLELFDTLPANETDYDKFFKELFGDLLIEITPIKAGKEVYKPTLVMVKDYDASLKGIREKPRDEIVEIIEKAGTHFHDGESYILYTLTEKGKKVYYVMFSDRRLKPLEAVKVSFSKTHPYEEADYFSVWLPGLTHGLNVQLKGFEHQFETSIDRRLFGNIVSVYMDDTVLNADTWLLPRSSFTASWRRRAPAKGPGAQPVVQAT